MKQGKIRIQFFSLLCVPLSLLSMTSPAWANSKSQTNVTSIQAGITADFNRDGIIDFNHKQKLTEDSVRTDFNTKDKPYVFWVNDDDDDPDSETAGFDISGTEINQRIDAKQNNIIDGTRDLIDFFAVALDLHSALSNENYDKRTYWLQQKDSAVNVVYTEMSRGTVTGAGKSTDYLKKIDVNSAQIMFGTWQTQGTLKEIPTHKVTESGIELPKEFIDLIKNDENKGIILVEGRSETTAPLKLVIKDENDNVIVEEKLPIRIYQVEKLFRQVSLRSGFFGVGRDEDSTKWGVNRVAAPDVTDLLTDLTTQGNAIKLKMPEINSTKHVIFVHGFKTGVDASKEYQLETFKRLYHSGSNAMFTGVHWNGNEGFITGITAGLNYWDNVENALYTADDFSALVNGITDTRTIIAHSLGNMMVGSAIQDFGMIYNHYFMVNPAVALEAYKSTTNAKEMRNTQWDQMYFRSDGNLITNTETFGEQSARRLWAVEWYQLFNGTGDARLSLTWRDRFKKVGDSTSVIQYYSSKDEVLKPATVGDPNDLGPLVNGGANAWNIQEKGKGTSELVTIGGGSAAGWGFNELCTVILPLSTINKPCRTLMHNEAQQYFDKTNIELIQEPFFGAFSNLDLLNLAVTQADAQAAVDKDYPRTLAYELPALSFAAGGTRISSFPSSRTLNMNTASVDGWPESRLQQSGTVEWLHNDLKNVAYRYTYKLFDSFVTEGALR